MSAPILGFHQLDGGVDDYTSMRATTFDRLIGTLAERYRFVTASEGLVAGDRSTIVLTFDDAYASILDPLSAAIAAHRVVATVYVISGHIGEPNTWNRKCGYWTEHLDLAGLRALSAAGCEIGSHTVEHFNLTKLPPDRLRVELRDSRAALEQQLCVEVPTVAYPYGFNSEAVRAEAALHYAHGLSTTTKPGGTDPARDRYARRRFMVTRAMTETDVLSGIEKLWGPA